MQIQVRIHEEGALRNQRYAFTNRFTLVSELLQNARRACASRVDVTHDPVTKTLIVSDDGIGIDDFQHLLTLHESGWDEITQRAERPFGVGFSKCLYAAERCIVRSNGRRIDFSTAAALAREPIDVIDDPEPVKTGSAVELHGVELADLEHRIKSLCMGFPIDVRFNGATLERPWAEDKLPTRITSIGLVHLCGAKDGRSAHDTLVFLQGFAVIRPPWVQPGEVNVVHLDPQLFMARLPDRDQLIDEDVQRHKIDDVLRDCWRQVLVETKTALAPRRFVDTYYDVMRWWRHLDLLNDVGELPGACFHEIAGYPYRVSDGERPYLRSPKCPPSRQDIESGAVVLVTIDDLEAFNAARWMFARARGWLLFDLFSLHDEHWVQRHVCFLDEDSFSVAATGMRTRSFLEGRWISVDVVLCESVRVTLGGESVEIGDHGVFDDGTLYIPDGETTGDPVRQCSDYTDEDDQFRSDELEADREALADLLLRLRSVNPRDTLDSLINGLRLERYPVLRGHRFELVVGDQAYGHAVELLG